MDYSFSKANLARRLAPLDFYLDPRAGKKDEKQELLAKAAEKARDNFTSFPSLKIKTVNGKKAYNLASLEDKLIFRQCAKNIAHQGKIKLKPRSQIVRELKSCLKEGTAYRVYKLDISSFFESINTENLKTKLESEQISTQTINIIEKFLSEYNKAHGQGLPRGIEISPPLSELYMKEFDSFITCNKEVFYYSRFVDDILIITSGKEDLTAFFKNLKKHLPPKLSFNHNKTHVTLAPEAQGSLSPNQEIEYLGYNFVIHGTNKTSFREIETTLTDKKLKRIITRIYKAFHSYSKNNDFQLLKNRLHFMATNRDLIQKNKKRIITTGIYYNYSEIDLPCAKLQYLDQHIKNLILHPRGRISKLGFTLSRKQKNELLKISFEKGHKNRVFKKYSPNTLRKISRIWQ